MVNKRKCQWVSTRANKAVKCASLVTKDGFETDTAPSEEHCRYLRREVFQLKESRDLLTFVMPDRRVVVSIPLLRYSLLAGSFRFVCAAEHK